MCSSDLYLPWICTVAHTSSGTISRASFRPLSFVNGTGNAGALAANGNADALISNDGIHPTDEGHDALDGFLSSEIVDRLRYRLFG